MTNLLYLSFKHAVHHRVRTCILVLCFAVAAYLPTIVQTLAVRYQAGLTERSAATPLVMGAKGNRFDLTLAALYFRSSDTETIPYREFTSLGAQNVGLVIPLNVRFTARGHPVVASSLEYFDVRGLALATGTRPLRLGDAVLGHEVARDLGLGPGDSLYSDQPTSFDISDSPSIELRVTGVLAPTGSPDDHAVITEIRTAWMLEGAMHGHADAQEADPRAVYAETPDGVVLNNAVRELNRLTPDNADSFHVHGDEGDLPLSSILFFPNSDKNATITKARINTSPIYQMLVPTDVINDLLGFVFRVKSFLDVVAATLAACVTGMTILVVLLTTRLRAREMRTLNAIGCGRLTVPVLYATELFMIGAVSLVISALGVGITHMVLPDLVTSL